MSKLGGAYLKHSMLWTHTLKHLQLLENAQAVATVKYTVPSERVLAIDYFRCLISIPIGVNIILVEPDLGDLAKDRY